MFKHHGASRTFYHNFKLAILLSFVSGIVNVSGLFAFGVLTTNVTGHFAFFSEKLIFIDYKKASIFLLFTLCFLLGAFLSNFISTFAAKKNSKNPHLYPILLEIILITSVGLSMNTENLSIIDSQVYTFSLLIAMGIQNALVTFISKSVVRTTHLTGLFTDLGIDISQYIFNQDIQKNKSLIQNMQLKFSIIFTFALGCILGGYLFQFFKIKTLLLASIFLLLIVVYYNFKNKNLIS